MKRRLRSLVAVAAICTLGGCFGQFALVRGLYEFNSSIENKFARTAVLWGLTIVPVYELAVLADFWVINVIEFWTGENPIELSDEPGATVRVGQASRDSVQFTVTLPGGELEQFELVRMGDNNSAVRAADGQVLSSAERLEDGSIVVTANGTVRVVRAAEVEALEARVGTGGLMSAARDLLWGESVVARR